MFCPENRRRTTTCLSLASVLLASLTAGPLHADHDTIYFAYDSPVAELARYEFSRGETLGVVSGTWSTSGGTFNSTSTATAIATIDYYDPEEWDFEPLPDIAADKFWYRARMLNQGSGSATRVGIIYLYKDRSNYYEASFSPTGTAYIREVTNGVATTVATGTYRGGGQNKWFDAEVQWTAAQTVIRVNGLVVVRGIKQNARTQGRVGLITRQTTAKFDQLLATREYGDPEFRESFTTREPAWNELKGNWSVVNGAYQNSAVEHAGITLLPIRVGWEDQSHTERFTVNARMLNPYGTSGNRMGFVYNYEGDAASASYSEVVFGPDGIARVNSVFTTFGPGGNTQIFEKATAPYPGRRGQWFDAEISGYASAGYVSVSVNGTWIFLNLEDLDSYGGPRLGLVTHWTPGRFDDVWFSHEGRFSAGENFDIPRDWPPWSTVRGTWDQTGGTLNSRAASANDLATLPWKRSTDYTLSGRMQNLYGGSANRIGLVFGFNFETGDYYEVLFAPTGEAYLNKFIQGQLTQIAASTHTALGRAVWFDVELARRGPLSTVKVNGQTVFQNVATGQLDDSLNSGVVGVITRWSRASFDDLQMEEYAPR
jgi:hypothetical protein